PSLLTRQLGPACWTHHSRPVLPWPATKEAAGTRIGGSLWLLRTDGGDDTAGGWRASTTISGNAVKNAGREIAITFGTLPARQPHSMHCAAERAGTCLATLK